MKILLKIMLWVALIAPFGVLADAPPPAPAPNDSQLVEHGSYINKDGERIHLMRRCWQESRLSVAVGWLWIS
jgi:hypothetical protein